jgi:hypothetical protein
LTSHAHLYKYIFKHRCQEEHLTIHYDHTGLPENLPRLRKAFECALHARDIHMKNIADPLTRIHKQDEWEQFIIDQTDAAKLLFSIEDNVPAEKHEAAAMASYLASTEEGLGPTLKEFGIAPTLFCLRAFMWVSLLKSQHAPTILKFTGQPSDRMREFTAATIITGFNRGKREFSSVHIDSNEKQRQLDHYKRTYPQALRLIKAETLPEPLAEKSRQVIADIANIHL